MSLLEKIFGDPNAREISRLKNIVADINALEPNIEPLSDVQLKEKTNEFKSRLASGASPDDVLPEAFALVREASKRTLGMRHFDVQLLTGMVLHRGQIAEMRTGEGKTLVATLSAYLNALSGHGVHIITVNDYLAKRDATWMGPIFHLLGLRVSCIQQLGASFEYVPEHEKSGISDDLEQGKVKVDMKDLRPITRKEAYEADVTYGTNNEFGFDYLRDNMAQTFEGQVQRRRSFGIVDEVDSILIDEARTPLIISAPAAEATSSYMQFSRIVPQLKEGEDYNVDEKMRASTLTEEGIRKVEQVLGIENLYAEGGMRLVHHLEQALKAHALFKRDKDYVVREGEVVIVDEFTGRLMHGRRYSDGLHQAIEAKENVHVQQESVTMATITFQNYFRLYEKLSGMTGTAKTEEEEFAKIYGLSVLQIPTHRSVIRGDFPDRVYKNESGKFTAVVQEIKQRVEIGQPVLVGTASIEKNEVLSTLLTRAGIAHHVLNAKNHEREAEIIAQSGRIASVTVATNMAGRGVDIVLGGNPPDAEQAQAVKNLGGLHVIGTERHESRRIDNQLRGRSGRQGDPGSSQFFISMEDDLMRIFGSDRMKSMMGRLGIPDDMPIENKIISKSIEQAQKKVEGHNFDIRKHVVGYDDVMNKQRGVIYRWRQEILEAEQRIQASGVGPKISETENTDVSDGSDNSPEAKVMTHTDRILDMVEEEIREIVNFHTQSEHESDWDLDEVYEVVDTIFPISIEVRLKLEDIYERSSGDRKDVSLSGQEALIQYLVSLGEEAYEALGQQISERGKTFGQEHAFERMEHSILLRSIDTLWVDHIDAMDHLRQGIGLRGYGQRDPLVEYKKEAYLMFEKLKTAIRKQVVYSIYKLGQLTALPQAPKEQGNLRFTGAEKTAEKGHGQFVLSGTSPRAIAAGNSSAPLTQSSALMRFAKKQAGVKSSPIIPGQKKGEKGKKKVG